MEHKIFLNKYLCLILDFPGKVIHSGIARSGRALNASVYVEKQSLSKHAVMPVTKELVIFLVLSNRH